MDEMNGNGSTEEEMIEEDDIAIEAELYVTKSLLSGITRILINNGALSLEQVRSLVEGSIDAVEEIASNPDEELSADDIEYRNQLTEAVSDLYSEFLEEMETVGGSSDSSEPL